jgi:hypothetical protein
VRATLTLLPPPHTSSPLARLRVSSSGTPRITRGTAASTLPLVGSSFLDTWCLMSPSFPTSPPPHHLLPQSSTTSRFPLTRWSSHHCCFLQVLLHRAPALLPAPASGAAPAPAPSAGPASSTSARFAQPVRIYQRRERPAPLHPQPVPSAPVVRFAQPVHVYQRRDRPAPQHPESVPPPPPASSTLPGVSSPPSTPTPPSPQLPAAQGAPSVYHPPLLHRHPCHVHPMVTRQAAGTLWPRALAVMPWGSLMSLRYPHSSVTPCPTLTGVTRWKRSMRHYSSTRHGI